MTTLVDCPDSTAGEWSFHIFDIPVRVKIWFWISILIIGGEQKLGPILIWVGVCFFSILLHELGHVAAFRLCGVRAEVMLYGWGGLAIPRYGVSGFFPRILVSLAGPFAGFCLAGITLWAALASRASIQFGFHMFLPVLHVVPRGVAYSTWHLLLNDLLWVNFYWGLMNLLPVYPLDGGQAALACFERSDPDHGKRKSLILSAGLAGALAIYDVLEQNGYLVLMFAILAVSSLQMLDGLRGSSASRANRSPRW